MIIYNVTVNIDHEACEEWLTWMSETHIPDVMATGYFKEYRMAKVLAQDEGGVTYSVQYLAPDMESYHRYVHQEAPRLQAESEKLFKDRYVAFRTILEVIAQDGQG